MSLRTEPGDQGFGVTWSGVPDWLENLAGGFWGRYLHLLEHIDCIHVSNANDETFRKLARLNHLKHLLVYGSFITDQGLRHLRHNESLESLELVAVTLLSERALEPIDEIKSLNSVTFEGPGFGDDHLRRLTSLHRFRALGFERTLITDKGLAQLQGLSALRELNLRDTEITDGGLESLESLRQLHFLDISATHISDRGVEILQDALPTVSIVRELESEQDLRLSIPPPVLPSSASALVQPHIEY